MQEVLYAVPPVWLCKARLDYHHGAIWPPDLLILLKMHMQGEDRKDQQQFFCVKFPDTWSVWLSLVKECNFSLQLPYRAALKPLPKLSYSLNSF